MIYMPARRTGLTVRPLKVTELKEMVRIWIDSGLPRRPTGRDSMANLKEQWRASPELFLGAFDGDKLVGVVIVSDDGRKGWINRLAVLPEAQGKGIAKMLIEWAERTLRKRGRLLFCVQIEHGNDASMRLFEKVGYHKENDIYYFTKREDQNY